MIRPSQKYRDGSGQKLNQNVAWAITYLFGRPKKPLIGNFLLAQTLFSANRYQNLNKTNVTQSQGGDRPDPSLQKTTRAGLLRE